MKKKVLFLTGGGTAGHVYPALAVLEELKQENPNLEVFWVGRKSSFEEKLIRESSLSSSIRFLAIQSGKLRRYLSLRNLIDPFKIIIGTLQSLYFVKKYKPSLVFSKGGFVSVPLIIASKILKIPSLTHESDLEPGLATKINAHFCSHILVGFEKTKNYFPSYKVTHVGNPIRKEFLNSNPKWRKNWQEKYNLPSHRPIVFVQGGSLGAKQINLLIDEIKDRLKGEFFLLHQSGETLPAIREENYWRIPFLDVESMVQMLALADVVISRSGASSLCELASLGKAMILIPLKTGSRGDQVKNARYFQENEAALVLEGFIDGKKLEEQIKILLENPDKREKLAYNASRLAQLNSAKICAQLIAEKFL